jgi:hypothetical protein
MTDDRSSVVIVMVEDGWKMDSPRLGRALDGQTDCFKTNRIRLSVVSPGQPIPRSVRWLGTVLDGQTDCVKTDRIRLSVVNPSAVRRLGTAIDGQTDCDTK